MSDEVRVFISWSGDLSREVAVALRDWLPLLFDRVKPWASDTDIAAGQRGLAEIERELEGTKFGIVVVTAANQSAPWINFEAGALSKTVSREGDEQRVVPLLVDLSRPTDLTGPLSQFQAKTADREGVLSLLRSLAASAGIDEGVVQRRFDAHWADLEKRVAAAVEKSTVGAPAEQPRRDPADVLDEILLVVRQLRAESEAPRASLSKKARDPASSDLFAIIAEHRFELTRATRKNDGVLDVVVAPAPGVEFSSRRVDLLREALSDAFGDVQLTAIPF